MTKQSTQFDFGDNLTPAHAFTLYDQIISDRGSIYSVSIGYVLDYDSTKIFLKTLKQQPNYHTATHHSYAVRISHAGTIYETKGDDGETGAGMVILRQLQKCQTTNVIVCVTRWFGGTKLMSDRFKHIQDATQYALDRMSFIHLNKD